MHLYICTHISAVCGWEELRRRKRVWEGKCGWEKGVGKGLLQSEWFLFLLILFNFMTAKCLFDVNMKCLFCGEFCWVMMMMMMMMMMIKMKISIMWLSFLKRFKKYIYIMIMLLKIMWNSIYGKVKKMALSFKLLL